MSKYAVERPRHLGQIKRIDEQTRVFDLPAAATAHEAPKLFLGASSLPLRLFLKGAEGSEVSLGLDNLLHGGSAESADQLVLQVCDAHVEAESFHVCASEVGAEARPFQTAPDVALLSGVADSSQPEVQPLRAEEIQEASYGLRTSHWNNRNALSVQIPSTALSERFERVLVTDPFDEHDRTQVDSRGPRVFHIPYLHSTTHAREH